MNNPKAAGSSKAIREAEQKALESYPGQAHEHSQANSTEQ